MQDISSEISTNLSSSEKCLLTRDDVDVGTLSYTEKLKLLQGGASGASNELSISYEELSGLELDQSGGIFTIQNEGHTLGNLLRWKLLRMDGVTFAAYNVPHPLQAILKIRIHTFGDLSPCDCFYDALHAIQEDCEKLHQQLKHAVKSHPPEECYWTEYDKKNALY